MLAGALFYTEGIVCSPSGTPKCRLDVVNSTFDSNRGSGGSGITVQSDFIQVSITSSTFRNNVALNGSGGAVKAYATDNVTTATPSRLVITVVDSVMTGNTAEGSGTFILGGGAMYAFNPASMRVLSSTFSNNSVGEGGSGGGLYVSSGSGYTVAHAYITNTIFSNNIGGVAGLSVVNMHCIAMVNTTFSNNLGLASSAASVRMVHGPPLMCVEAALTFANETLSTPSLFVPLAPPDRLISAVNYPNLAPDILYWSPVNVDVRGCLFTNNSAAFAGSLLLEASLAPTAVSNCTFRNNSVTQNSGGALASNGISNFEFYMSGCLFAYNSASERGGALFLRSVASLSSIWNSTFIGNQAVSGAAIYVGGGPLRINTTIMEGNKAGLQGGGAVTCTDCQHLEMKEVNLLNNSAQELGGAVKVTGSQVYSVWLDQVQAHGNR